MIGLRNHLKRDIYWIDWECSWKYILNYLYGPLSWSQCELELLGGFNAPWAVPFLKYLLAMIKLILMQSLSCFLQPSFLFSFSTGGFVQLWILWAIEALALCTKMMSFLVLWVWTICSKLVEILHLLLSWYLMKRLLTESANDR